MQVELLGRCHLGRRAQFPRTARRRRRQHSHTRIALAPLATRRATALRGAALPLVPFALPVARLSEIHVCAGWRHHRGRGRACLRRRLHLAALAILVALVARVIGTAVAATAGAT